MLIKKKKYLSVLFFGIAIVTFLSVSVILDSTTKVASAATFYKTKPGDCGDGGLKVTPDYTNGDKNYYCVRDIKNGEYSGRPCGAAPTVNLGFPIGDVCLTQGDYKFVDNDTGKEKKSAADKVPRNNKANASTCENDGEPSTLCGLFDNYINPAIKFLSIGVGVIVTIMIIIGGIQYSAAGGDPQATAAAKKRISNAILALLAYALIAALLEFLVPGGVF